jgi:hypothetical protein
LTSSLHAARLGSQTPRVSTYPPATYTSGPDAADLAAVAGLHLDPWQRYVLDHGLGEQEDGRWAAREVACWVPRQNGKGVIIEARVLAGLFLFGEKRILWSAHEYKTAQEGFLRIRELIQGTPAFDARVKRYWEGSGEQGIELLPREGETSGQRLKFIARSRGSGRGFSGDLIILDEAQELTLLQMKALFSTMSAKSITGNPQIWYFGTPPETSDAWVYGLRRDGAVGKDRLAWFDWGLGDIDLSEPMSLRLARYADRDLWAAANPGLGIRISEEFCEDELSRLREGFASERLGLWLPPAEDVGLLDRKMWAAMADPASRRADGADLALAIDVAPMRDHASIAMFSVRADGREHLQLIDYREGTEWLVDRVVELRGILDPICFAYDAKNGAHALLDDLAKHGIVRPQDRPDWDQEPKRGDLLELDTSAMVDAVGQFIDGFRAPPVEVDGRPVPSYAHLGQQPLDLAVQGAGARPVGDAGQIAWARRAAEVDIGPLVAVTAARYAYYLWKDVVRDDYDVLNSVF